MRVRHHAPRPQSAFRVFRLRLYQVRREPARRPRWCAHRASGMKTPQRVPIRGISEDPVPVGTSDPAKRFLVYKDAQGALSPAGPVDGGGLGGQFSESSVLPRWLVTHTTLARAMPAAKGRKSCLTSLSASTIKPTSTRTPAATRAQRGPPAHSMVMPRQAERWKDFPDAGTSLVSRLVRFVGWRRCLGGF